MKFPIARNECSMLERPIDEDECREILRALGRYGGTPAADENTKARALDLVRALIDRIDELEGR